MVTERIPASKAGKELSDKKSTNDEKMVAGSDLSQAKKRSPTKPTPKPKGKK